MTASLAIVLVTVIALIFYWLRNQRPKNFPPGPTPFPFIGNILTVGSEDNSYINLKKLSKIYGDIVGLNLGGDRCVCVHGTQLIKEVYNNPALLGKPRREAFDFVAGDNMGIFSATGTVWAEQRRFALRHLRDFGFGKSSTEEMIMDEVENFIDFVHLQNGAPFRLQHRFSLAAVNSLWKIVTGTRFDQGDEKLHNILEDLKKACLLVYGFSLLQNLAIFYYPSIGKMFPRWSGRDQLVELAQSRFELYNQIILDHETKLDTHPKDFIDAYLLEIRQTTDPTSSFHANTSGVRSLRSVMADFFVAGTGTTAVSLTFLHLYLLHNPRVQEKMHAELDRVIGQSRQAGFDDRLRLPYLEAVILETLRMSSIAPTSIKHAASEDTILQGYKLPKGTIVYANLHANHYDPLIWGEDVEEFRPERFLSPDETVVLKNEALMPFSTGKRMCPGEKLAKDTLFLFAANLGLHFDVCGIEGQDLPPLGAKSDGLVLAPISDLMVLKKRKPTHF